MKDFYIMGETYHFREALKALGAHWSGTSWKISLPPSDSRMKEIKIMGLRLVPVNLEGEAKTIQDILGRKK